MAGKSSPSAKYLQRAEMFVKAVDIAADVLPGAPQADHLIQFGQQLKDLAQRPPQTLAGLRHLEAAFFTYWNETSGPHVNRFWQLIADNDLPYARTDVIGDVLKRGRIRTITEYEVVVDSIVVAQQVGTITSEQAALLSDLIGRFEHRRPRR
jgi:hypothetical protein